MGIMTDNEFNIIVNTKKIFVSPPSIINVNEKKTYKLKSTDGKDDFYINAERKNNVCGRNIELSRIKLHHSYYKEPLIRVEVDSKPHINPDGSIVGRNHIHIYKEGYGMSIAYDLEDFHLKLFKEYSNVLLLFVDFCIYCNVDINFDLQGVI